MSQMRRKVEAAALRKFVFCKISTVGKEYNLICKNYGNNLALCYPCVRVETRARLRVRTG